MKCVPVTPHKVYLETRTASRTSTATNMTVIAVGVTAGLILVAVVVRFVKARARKRGMFHHPASRHEMLQWVCGMVVVE